MLAGIHCPKVVEIKENPGRPAHSVPTGLTPPHPWVRYFHWINVTCKYGSRTRRTSHILLVDSKGIRFNPKAHMPVPRSSNGETTHSRGNVECGCATLAKRRTEGPRRRAARPKKVASEESTQGTDVQEQSGVVHGRSVARWHTPRPADLGRAARPRLAASRLPALRGS